MKRKIVYKLICIILAIGSLICICLNHISINEIEEPTEYIPQEEISEAQERKTLVTLYFISTETKELMPETRLIDAIELVENPYKTLVNLLISGPKNEKLQSVIPKGTKVNSAKIEKGTLLLDLNSEFIKEKNLGIEEETKIVYSIVNTLTELKEIDCVQILINGKEGQAFEDGQITFTKAFKRV